jgi:hypothetical protein
MLNGQIIVLHLTIEYRKCRNLNYGLSEIFLQMIHITWISILASFKTAEDKICRLDQVLISDWLRIHLDYDIFLNSINHSILTFNALEFMILTIFTKTHFQFGLMFKDLNVS